MLSYLVIIVIVIIAAAAVAGTVIAFKKHRANSTSITKYARWLDARTEAGFAEIVAFCKATTPTKLNDASTVEVTSTTGKSGGKFAMFVTSTKNAREDVNVYVGINESGDTVYFILAKTGDLAHILTSDFKFVHPDGSIQTTVPSTEAWRIKRSSAGAAVNRSVLSALKKIVPANATPSSALALVGTDLSQIAVAKKISDATRLNARLSRKVLDKTITIPVDLVATSASNVFFVSTATSTPKDLGFVVIEGTYAFIVDTTGGLVVLATEDGSTKNVKWPSKVRIPDFFTWSIVPW